MSEKPPKVHFVKCVQPFFDEVWDERKNFEVRKSDRDYQPGDILVQREFDGRFYKDRSTVHRIGYVLTEFAGLRKGYCAFSLLEPQDGDHELVDQAEAHQPQGEDHGGDKLTAAQLEMLRFYAEQGPTMQSDGRGTLNTWWALIRRGLLARSGGLGTIETEITPAGLAALQAEEGR